MGFTLAEELEIFSNVVGITWSIGSGKSTVEQIFVSHGYHLIDADVLARKAVEPGTPALLQLVHHFGRELLLESGELNRKFLADLIFTDAHAKEIVESIIHPFVRDMFLSEAHKILESGEKNIIYDVPLLFEAGLHSRKFRAIIVVVAPIRQCIERIVKRSGISIEHALARFTSQMPVIKKAALADYVIDNSGDLALTMAGTKLVIEKLGNNNNDIPLE